jgi:hypothetical protein
MLRRIIGLIGSAALLAACSAGPPDGSTPGIDGTGIGTAAAPLASVTLRLEGGSQAGRYTGTITDGGCSRSPFGEGTFAVASARFEGSGGFQGPHVTILDTDAARAGTDGFGIGLSFAGDINLVLNAAEGDGSGTLTLDDRGDTATIRVEGTLASGLSVSVEIDCREVFDYD